MGELDLKRIRSHSATHATVGQVLFVHHLFVAPIVRASNFRDGASVTNIRCDLFSFESGQVVLVAGRAAEEQVRGGKQAAVDARSGTEGELQADGYVQGAPSEAGRVGGTSSTRRIRAQDARRSTRHQGAGGSARQMIRCRTTGARGGQGAGGIACEEVSGAMSFFSGVTKPISNVRGMYSSGHAIFVTEGNHEILMLTNNTCPTVVD